MKIVLFGAAGQVGTDCTQTLNQAGYSVTALTRADVDFAEPDAVAAKLREVKPELVINACAYTAVDKAEQEQELADKVNHLSVLAMAEQCRQLAIPLIHISTDYVFDGTATTPYTEGEAVNALGVYGATKLAGEEAIQQAMDTFVILRTSWVFGEHGSNFVKTMLRLGADRDHLNIVDDQIGRPSYVGDIVSAIVFFVERFEQDNTLPWGTYHCSSEGQISWYGFAEAIFALAKEKGVLSSPPTLSPITSAEYPTPAPRPAYSVLNTDKLTALMGKPMPHWRDGLEKLLDFIQQSSS